MAVGDLKSSDAGHLLCRRAGHARAALALPVLGLVGALWGLGCAGVSGSLREPAFETDFLEPNAANIAVLVLNHQTVAFEGARVLHFAACSHCADDSIPLSYIYHSPGDFGDIAFHYVLTGEPVFAGTIIWMGNGAITYPEIIPAVRFARFGSGADVPTNVRCFLCSDDNPPPLEEIWRNIGPLELVKAFEGPDLRVGIYLYPPTEGMFDPRPAKWIVFLYRRT